MVLKINAGQAASSVGGLVEAECTKFRLRRSKIISENLSKIFHYLEAGGWASLMEHLKSIETRTTQKKERSVINFLLSKDGDKKLFPGIGQKQSRNLIQWLGLSKYEIPIDSRTLKKLNEFGAEFTPGGSALADEAVYLFVQNLLWQIAERLNIFPCELDAYIFASFDSDD